MTKEIIGYDNIEEREANAYEMTDEVSSRRIPWINEPKLPTSSIESWEDTGDLLYCNASLTSNQSIATSSSTIINFDSYDTNDAGMSVVWGRITITKDWRYAINATIEWDDVSVACVVKWNMSISWNQNYRNNQQKPAISSFIVSHSFSDTLNLTTGDYIELEVFHNRWSNLSISGSTGRFTLLTVTQIS